MKKRNSIIWGVVILLAIVLGVGGTMFSVSGGTSYGIDALGNLIVPGESLFQAYSLYEIGTNSYTCFVDDSRNAGCKVTKTVLSVPAGSQIVHHIDSSVDYVGGGSGWEGYGSCVGFMMHYGCDPKACAFHNGGVCYGLDTDASGIECGTNIDCDRKYPGDGFSCMYGKCQARVAEGSSLYKCYKGQIYVVMEGRYKMFGSCMDKYSVSKCADGLDEVTGDNLRDVCQADCLSDSDCKAGYACQKVKYTVAGTSQTETGGRCILQSAKDSEDDTFIKQELALKDLQVKAAECAMDGGEWTGTSCVQESSDEAFTADIQEEVFSDYLLVTCSDGIEIWYSGYEAGERCSDGNTPEPVVKPGISSYTSSGWAMTAGVILALAAVAGAGYLIFRPKKKKR